MPDLPPIGNRGAVSTNGQGSDFANQTQTPQPTAPTEPRPKHIEALDQAASNLQRKAYRFGDAKKPTNDIFNSKSHKSSDISPDSHRRGAVIPSDQHANTKTEDADAGRKKPRPRAGGS